MLAVFTAAKFQPQPAVEHSEVVGTNGLGCRDNVARSDGQSIGGDRDESRTTIDTEGFLEAGVAVVSIDYEAADRIARRQLEQVKTRIHRLKALKAELERMIVQCRGGRVANGGVIRDLLTTPSVGVCTTQSWLKFSALSIFGTMRRAAAISW